MRLFFAYWAAFSLICLFVQMAVDAYASDHGQTGDEAAHFVTSLMIYDYVTTHLLSNPLTYARDYYAHFPRVAIGHFPPMFEVAQAALFLASGRMAGAVIAFQALVGGLCAALPAALLGGARRLIDGWLAGIAILCSPSLLFLISMDMADNFLAALVMLTALAWSRFYHRRTWTAGLMFAALAASSILTKGTAFGLVLLPVIYLAYKRDLPFLLDRKTIVAGCLTGMVTVPWYTLTYKLAANGFGYTWGLQYTAMAAPFFAWAVVASVGIPLAFLYLISLFLFASSRDSQDGIDVHAMAALSLCMIVFPIVAPSAMTIRYLIPALPSVVVLALCALHELMRKVPSLRNRPGLAPALSCVIVFASAASVFEKPHAEPYHSDQLSAYILKSGTKNSLVLVAGENHAEGAIIASFAEQDRAWSHFVVRGSEVLSTSNWLGTTYQQRFDNPAALSDWIRRNEIGWIIVEAGASDDPPANRMLRQALSSGLLEASRVASVRRALQGEELILYRLPAVDVTPKNSNDIFSALKPSMQF